MSKISRRLSLVLLLIFCFIFIDTIPLYADGKVFGGMDLTSLQPIDENIQKAAIVHQSNLQKMIIAVNIKLSDSDKALWIFPVPGTPDKVNVEITDKFPDFNGWDIRYYASTNIYALFTVVRASQIYTLPFMLGLIRKSAGPSDVSFIKQVDKWGIHAETIKATSLDGFSEYLKEKKIGIDRKALVEFEPYLSNKYVLVLARISSPAQLLKEFPEYHGADKRHNDRWPCLYVEFPTQKAFYPLKPSSGYGKTPMNVLLYIVGSVKPEISSPLSKYIKMKYFHENETPTAPRRFTETLTSKNTPYTRINLEAPADAFTEDLWFSNTSVPWGIGYAEMIQKSQKIPLNLFLFFLIVLTALLSYVSAGITGLILFRKWKGYAKIGLFNVLSILAIIVAAFLKFEQRIWPPRKALLFVIFFSIVFIVLTIIIEFLFQYPLLDDFSDYINFF